MSTFHGCFCCRSCRAKDFTAPFSVCRTRFSKWITMRIRSESTESEGFRLNFLSDQRGRWLRRLLRGPRSQGESSGNNSPSPTDPAPQSTSDEEPDNGIPTNHDESCLCEASRLLIEREERLFGEITEAEALKHHKEEADKLAADYSELKNHILQILWQSLSLNLGEDNTLTSAIKTILQEEEQDQLWKQKDRTPPAWRPCGWKELHNTTLWSLVKERMDNPSTPPADQVDQSSIQADVNSMGRQLKDDLVWVADVVKTCYPPEMNICNFYATMYHQTFSARLRKIADFGLGDKDCTFLLRWVNEYYPEILQKSELASEIDTGALGKLLPNELLEPLEEQYLCKQQSELMIYIGRVLDEAEQSWNNGEEPKREYGCYISPVAYDIIQLINGMVTSAKKVVGDQHKAQRMTCKLNGLMQRFKGFQDNIIKQNRPNSKAYIKANLGSVEQFRDVLDTKSHLFHEDVREDCLCVLNEMKQSAHMYLLNPVHDVLRPQYRKLGTSDWLNKDVFEKLLDRITTEMQDLRGSTESCHQELICQFHQDVTVEYVKRLLKGEVKLKDKERQHQAFMTVTNNAEKLHSLFAGMGSKEDWLKEILTKIAEVLKLQNVPAIQMQVASLGSTFPDLSEKHVSALLKLKTNISKAERKTVKATLSDTLKETSVVDARPFFSKVQVK